ncbi:non-ribosomal peptide synthetase [Streptomyces solincola]|nr:non-ribosomal peptide synthetase [Streptomyces solincola]
MPQPQELGRTALPVLHELFERRAAEGGARVALTDGPRTHTYAELNRAANRLAHRLRRLGAGPGSFVGVCSDRSADLVVALIAVLKSGAAYVPLDPAYPAERTRFTLADTRCRVVLGQERHRAAFAGDGVAYLSVEGAAEAGPGSEDANPASGVEAGQPAYVIHTSGSTGTPKGVVVTHANAVRLFTACQDELGIDPEASDDVWTLFHSAAFDFSVWEVWGALLHGGRLVVVPYSTSRSPETFLRLLSAERVTVLSQTPTAFRQLLRAAEAEGFPETALRLVVFGGEVLEPATLRPWIAHYGDKRPRLVNMYGITETTVHVTLRTVTAADCDAPGSPIGRPLRDLRVHLLDAGMRPVAPGEQGEMYVGGAGVTAGYLNRPELTARSFIPDPFGKPGERLYRTGDLAVRLPDGELEFRGRADDQVQLRGFRIELGEVEAALSGLPAVREAAVILRQDALGEPMLVGYAVPAPGAATGAGALRDGLAERLPAHLVPPVLVLVDSFPLTPNGKLDRAALPEPAPRTAVRDRTAENPGSPAPSRPTAHVLHDVWARALGRDAVEPEDNFFALGGDSITAIRTVGMAREAGVAFTVEQLFRYPSLAELAPHCAASTAPGTPEQPPARHELLHAQDRGRLPTGVRDAYPLTALQLGMVFESQFSGDPTVYHDLVSVRIEGPLDPAALRRTLGSLASRHDILRTSFDLGSYSEPLQLVHEDVTVPLRLHDHLPPAATPGERVKEWWRQEWQRPFDFEQAPLWRCHVHDHGDGHFQLSVSAHHSILDGWSFSLLVTELIDEYERETQGAAAADVRPALPYRAYVELERAQSGSVEAQRYWAQALAGAAPLPLPEPTGAGAASPLDPDVRREVPAAVVDAVRACADRWGLPKKSLFLAAHVWALRAATGAVDITTGIVAGGRPEAAHADRALGLFLHSVPLRADARGGTWAGLTRQLFAGEQALQPFRRFPLSDIQAMVGAAPFSVLFNYTDFRAFDDLDGLRTLRVGEWWFCDRTSFPLVVEIGRQPMGEDWELTVRSDAAKTDPAFGERLAAHFLEALSRICEDPSGDY